MQTRGSDHSFSCWWLCQDPAGSGEGGGTEEPTACLGYHSRWLLCGQGHRATSLHLRAQGSWERIGGRSRGEGSGPVLTRPHGVTSGASRRLSSGQELGSLGASPSLWSSERF